jgi:hypothetical protein
MIMEGRKLKMKWFCVEGVGVPSVPDCGTTSPFG